MMERRTAPRFPCSPEGIVEATSEFERFARERSVPEAVRRDVVVSMDEMLSNVLKYAHDDDLDHHFSFRCDLEGELLKVQLIYAGREFDPTTVPDPQIGGDLDDRPVGGLGIYLVKKLMDDIDYRRQGGLNHLVICKRTGVAEEV
jgi:anti-sigma regulatory factor (Ser/Thr protein kinase)